MDKVRFEAYNGMEYLYNDMSGCLPEEAEKCLMKSHELMCKCPEKSVLVLANVEKIRFNKQIVQTFKDVTKLNAPYVRTTAVFGLEGFTKLLVNTVAKFSGREMKAFDDLDKAKDWLHERYLQTVPLAQSS